MCAACSAAHKSAALLSDVCGSGLALLRPSPAGSHEHTRVVAATPACTWLQEILQPLPPAVRTTVGLPLPVHTRWMVRPPGRCAVFRVPAYGRSDVSTATGAACCAVADWQENDARAIALPSAAKLGRDVIAPLRCITLRTFLDGKVVFRKCYHEGRLPNAETGGPAGPPHRLSGNVEADQRFENWKLRRAFARPYFLRSTTRLSRVRKPAALTEARKAGSNFASAWLMPCLTAPAWPERPPPLTVAITSYWPSRPATRDGRLITRRRVG